MLNVDDATHDILIQNYKAAGYDTTAGSTAGDADFSAAAAAAPKTGQYRLKCITNELRFRVNGVAAATDAHLGTGESILLDLEAGDTVSLIRYGSNDALANLCKCSGS